MKKIFETSETDYDGKTGEVIKKNKTSVCVLPSEPDYIKLYLQDICYLNSVPKSLQDVMYCLLQHLDYRNNIVLTTRTRKKIATDLGIKPQTVTNKISSLARAGVIKITGRNDYKVNTLLFGRGQWRDILQLREDGAFELTIKYQQGRKRTLSTTKSVKETPEDQPDALVRFDKCG